MTDNLSPEQRRRAMRRVRNKDTDIEQLVRSALHRRGYRFRKHVRALPGSPDVVFTRAKVAVFIDGDFWHGFDFEEWADGLTPFWRAKISRNIARDAASHAALAASGWRVIRVWQHEVKRDVYGIVDRIAAAVDARPASTCGLRTSYSW